MKRWMMLCAMGMATISLFAETPGTQPAIPAAPRPTTSPTTGPSTRQAAYDAEKELDRLLRVQPGLARPIDPISAVEAGTKRAKRRDTPTITIDVPLRREGDVMSRRVGRLQKQESQWQFHFESDGTTLADPPMILLPNQMLMKMEDALKRNATDLRFRVTGMITVYRGENYLLIEKAEVVPNQEGL